MVFNFNLRLRLANLKWILPLHLKLHKKSTCELFGVFCRDCSFVDKGEVCILSD